MRSPPSARTLAEAMEGADVFFGLSVKGAVNQAMVKSHGQEPDHLRHGQSRSRDHARGRARRALGRHHRHRPLGLPEPDQQRAGLSLHLPRRARRARLDHQRRHEDRGRPCAGRAGARGRARRGRGGLFRPAPAIRAATTSCRRRSTRASSGRCPRRWPRRRWTPAWRASRSPTWTPTSASLSGRLDPTAASLQRALDEVAPHPKRVVFAEGEEEKVIRAALSFRDNGYGTPVLIGREERIRDDHAPHGARRRRRSRDAQCAAVALQQDLYRFPLCPPPAPRRAASRLPAHGQPGPQRLRRLHGGLRRRRRHGHRRHAQLLHRLRGGDARARAQGRQQGLRLCPDAVARPLGARRRHHRPFAPRRGAARRYRRAIGAARAADDGAGAARRLPLLFLLRQSAALCRPAHARGGGDPRPARRRFRI